MSFPDFDQQHEFRRAWEAVHIARPVHYSLFTFGESELPYFLVCAAPEPDSRAGAPTDELPDKSWFKRT